MIISGNNKSRILTEEKKKISFWQRLREKYRISIVNEYTLSEHWHLHLSGWGAIVVLAILFLLSLALFSLVILYTPIKHYLPGYSEDIRQELVQESVRLDSIGTSLELQRQYLNIIYNKKALHRSAFLLLSHEDSNLDKQNQNLLCYHYTIGQSLGAFC